MSEGATQKKADAARDAIRWGIEYLADVDGYGRDDLQSLVDDFIAEMFEDD